MDDLNEMARLHSAGATVIHVSPFNNLQSHRNNFELTTDFIEKWAVPYYMRIGSYENDDWMAPIKKIKNKITKEVTLSLLGDFNWRTRLVGAYFGAVKDYAGLVDIIGTHLLKSELCCVGHIYSLTLAFFNSGKCIQYLNDYLDYYLTKPHLYFDQEYVMGALLYLDKINGTRNGDKQREHWDIFKKVRNSNDEERIAEFFEEQIQKLKELNQYSSGQH
jgi:hypothetical protein